MGHVGPTFNLIKKITKVNKTKAIESLQADRRSEGEKFLNFSLLNLLSSIHRVPTVGFRRVKHEMCSTR